MHEQLLLAAPRLIGPIPAWGSASIIEIIWTLIAFLGVAYSRHNYREAKGDFEAVPHERHGWLAAWMPEHGDNPLTILYRMLFRNEQMRLFVQGAFLLAGVLALFQESPALRPGVSANFITPAGLVIIVCLIGAHLFMALCSFKDAYARRRLQRALQ